MPQQTNQSSRYEYIRQLAGETIFGDVKLVRDNQLNGLRVALKVSDLSKVESMLRQGGF